MIISNEALQENPKPWQSLGPIAEGGTVFGVGISPIPEVSRCWAATGCGVYFSDDLGDSWTQTLDGLTTPLLSTLAVAPNGALFVGALGGDLFASFNWGKTWEPSNVPDELRATITTIVASPNFRNDGTVFAATDGRGLLVSRNSAKTWEDSSFGLGDDSVLALAAAPDWSQREIMFAATTLGVHISVNGGRAWRDTELMMDDDTVSVLAVSPAFGSDRTVYAGTEKGNLYRSTDGGRTWELLATEIAEGPVNCLWLSPDYAENGRMLAGIGSRIMLSDDRGESWRTAYEGTGSVLSLAGDRSVVLAGLYDAGLFKSEDGGATWRPASKTFSARGFARLIVADESLYALGPQEGLWASKDEGRTWRELPGLRASFPLTAAFIDPKRAMLVASQERGILRSTDGGETWAVVCETQGVQTLMLVPDGEAGLAGTSAGKLLATQDGGLTWQDVPSPCEGQEILTIVASPAFAQDRTLLMGTAIPAVGSQQPRVALWRSTDGGATWRQVTTQNTPARWMDIAMPLRVSQNVADQAVLATGTFCLRPLRRAKEVWISTRVDPGGANTLSVLALGEIDSGGVLYAATGTGIYRSIDGGRTWQPFSQGLDRDSFISIVDKPQGDRDVLYALSLGGTVWKRELF